MASLKFNDDEVTIILCVADLRENCGVNRFSTDTIVRKSAWTLTLLETRSIA